jgi:hypothetical protein
LPELSFTDLLIDAAAAFMAPLAVDLAPGPTIPSIVVGLEKIEPATGTALVTAGLLSVHDIDAVAAGLGRELDDLLARA